MQQASDNGEVQGLKEKSASEKEAARLSSLSIQHFGPRLSAPLPALELHTAPNEFRNNEKYSLGVPVCDVERKYSSIKQ